MIIKPSKEVCDDVEDSSFPNLVNLLWDDILISHLLPYLSLKELFILRGMSRKYKLLIDTYFCHMKVINLAKHRSKFTVVAFKVLSDLCTQLRDFYAPKCTFLTDELVIPLFEKNPCIKNLLVSGCDQLTSVCLQPIIINCKSFWRGRSSTTTIEERCEDITSFWENKLSWKNNKGLRALAVEGCSWLTVGCLESIQLHQQELTDINFSSCPVVNEPSIINKFFTFEPELENLNLRKLDCINDSTLCVLAKCAKKLRTINLTGCTNITDYGVCMLVEHCRYLRCIVVGGCYKLSDWSTRACHQRNIYIEPQPSKMIRALWPPQPRLNV